jgi:proline dehydrogenase
MTKRIVSRYGMRPDGFARRFVPGETLDEAVAAARPVEARGCLHTLDFLGESVTTLGAARDAALEYHRIIDVVTAAGIGRNLSLKLTQLGLDLDRATALDHLRGILEKAEGFFVRIDMEQSRYTAATLDVFDTLWEQGYRHVGVVLQADLHRTDQDARRLVKQGVRIRLVKGAYKEPRSVAYQRKADVNAAFERLMRLLLIEGTYPAIATHDEAMLAATRRFAAEQGIGKDRFEFQMLYGVRRDLQASLVAEGYRLRVYIPFGHEWFPYFMRRLGERPANIAFVIRSVMRERRGPEVLGS